MNQQDDLGARIAHRLAEGTDTLTAAQRDRLAEARRLALSRQRAVADRVRVPALAGVGGPIAHLTEGSMFGIRYFLPLAVLVAGLFGVVYLHTGTVAPEIAEVDVGLLTDELPIDAFLDGSLDSWLKRSAR